MMESMDTGIGEIIDRVDEHPGMVQRMLKALDAWEKDVETQRLT